jgi:hypothetical protein
MNATEGKYVFALNLCSSCNGEKEVTCPTCKAKELPTEKCSQCKGDGKVKGEESSDCSKCKGSGKSSGNCSKCDGKGKKLVITQTSRGSATCSNCKGQGRLTRSCSYCKGDGSISISKTLDCNYCEGKGELKAVCNHCINKKQIPCWLCKGIGIDSQKEKQKILFDSQKKQKIEELKNSVIGLKKKIQETTGLVEYERKWIVKEEYKKKMIGKGLVEYEDQWVTKEEKKLKEELKFKQEQLAKGLVEYGGKWFSREELVAKGLGEYEGKWIPKVALVAKGLGEYEGKWFSREELVAKGLVKYQGQWLSKQQLLAKDLVEYGGEWFTREEKAKREKEVNTNSLKNLPKFRALNGLFFSGVEVTSTSNAVSGKMIFETAIFVDTLSLQQVLSNNTNFDKIVVSLASNWETLSAVISTTILVVSFAVKEHAKPIYTQIFPSEDIKFSPKLAGKKLYKFEYGEVRTLDELISQYGMPDHIELWDTTTTSWFRLQNDTYWWGNIGVSADKEMKITHILVRSK